MVLGLATISKWLEVLNKWLEVLLIGRKGGNVNHDSLIILLFISAFTEAQAECTKCALIRAER